MQTLRIYISKPADVPWKEAGALLRDLQFKTAKILNMAMIEWYLWQKGKEDIKNREGKYPAAREYLLPDKKIYHEVRKIYSEINSGMVSAIIRVAYLKWKSDCKDVFFMQNKSLSSYRKTTPVLVPRQGYNLNKSEGDLFFSASLFSRNYDGPSSKIKFILNTKKFNSGRKNILNKIISGEFKSGTAQIGYNSKKNKWFVNIPYEPPASDYIGNPAVVVGVAMGAVKSFICSVTENNSICQADAEEILRYRKIIRGRRTSIQRQGPFSGRKGKGVKNILKPIEKLQHKERNFRDTRYHQYSKMIVDFALKHNAGSIQFESLACINDLVNDKIALKDWALGDLQEKIKYKAEKKGIEIVFVENNDVGCRCSKCGFVYDGNRISEDRFLCFQCGHEDIYDYNKSRNLSLKNLDEVMASGIQMEKEIEVRDV